MKLEMGKKYFFEEIKGDHPSEWVEVTMHSTDVYDTCGTSTVMLNEKRGVVALTHLHETREA